MEKNFKSIIEELNTLKTQLSEDYLFNGEEPMQGEMGGEPIPQEGMPQQQMPQGASEEEKAMRAQEIIKHEPIVAKIRETAIEGLKKYADHPTSDLYSYFKSVFLDSDKLLTSSGGKK